MSAAQGTMWDQAEASLNEYRGKVNDGLTSALINDYTTLAQTADSLVASTTSNGSAVIVSDFNEYWSNYLSICQAAEDAGTNITVCINSFEERITNVSTACLNGLHQCVQDLVEPVVTYISDASTGLVQRYLDTVYQNEKSVLTCGPLNDTCLNYPVYVLAQANARVQSQIANDLARDVGQFGMYESQLSSCAAKYTSINHGQGNSYVEGFKSCVDAQPK